MLVDLFPLALDVLPLVEAQFTELKSIMLGLPVAVAFSAIFFFSKAANFSAMEAIF